MRRTADAAVHSAANATVDAAVNAVDLSGGNATRRAVLPTYDAPRFGWPMRFALPFRLAEC
jgi:hypothetical protein